MTRPSATLRICDPIDGPLGGAWRDLATNDLGVVDGGSRGGGLVHLKLTLHAHERAWLTLRPAGPARRRGRMDFGDTVTEIEIGFPGAGDGERRAPLCRSNRPPS